MFTKIANSWELVKSSARVLRADKELLVFPVVSAIGTLVVTLTFFLPVLLTGVLENLISERLRFLGYVVLFIFYLTQYFVIFFSNTALVGAAIIRLRGGDPTIRDGFRIAFSKFSVILGYALIAATVGMVLKIISDKSKGLGKLVVSLIGFVWNIATFLVVPILAVEDVGPIEAIRRSTQMLKKTWGEQIVGNLGMGAFFGVVTLLILVIGIPVVVLTAIYAHSLALTISLGILVVLTLILVGLVNSTLNGIYTAAVYLYAVGGRSDGFFEAALVEKAFRRA